MPITNNAGTGRTQATSVSGAVNTRTEASTGNFASTATVAANTPLTVFTPASNTSGAIVLGMNSTDNAQVQVFIAKTSAPTGVTDGEVMAMSGTISASGTTTNISVNTPQYIAAGKGLYFISSAAGGAAGNFGRACRYILL